MRLQKSKYVSRKILFVEKFSVQVHDNIPHDTSHTVTHTSENKMHTYRRGNSMIEMEESNACNHGM